METARGCNIVIWKLYCVSCMNYAVRCLMHRRSWLCNIVTHSVVIAYVSVLYLRYFMGLSGTYIFWYLWRINEFYYHIILNKNNVFEIPCYTSSMQIAAINLLHWN